MDMYSLSDICDLIKVEADDGMPAWANLKCKKKKLSPALRAELGGGGVYACFWRNRLIYIGEFVNGGEDPFGGNVYDRISKHATGFLMRAKQLFFHREQFDIVIEAGGGHSRRFEPG